ncbi:hypothetical protein JB92DRAFT_2991789 [Gautieria morchelliformis]|nr:hypothetical protein JB92DRAFT_2991789 [Gautieria morchelliformis]
MSNSPFRLATVLEATIPTKYSWLAAWTFMLYDHAITLDVEVAHIWTYPLSFGKALFIWTRYFGIFSFTGAVVVMFCRSLSDKASVTSLHDRFFSCSIFFWWEAMCIVILNTSVQVILLARVYAVYNRNKTLVYGVGGLRLLTTTASIVLLWLYLPPGRGLPPLASLSGCASSTTLNHFLAFAFVPPILDESILCLCMLYKAWITYKHEYGSPLLKGLIQDSTFVVLFANILFLSFASPGFMEFALGWEYVVPCCIGGRLLLKMFEESGKHSDSPLHSFRLSCMRT